MEHTVQQIIERVRAGEIDAFGEIVTRYQGELWRIAAYALRDVAATEDLVQRAFVKAYLGLGSYDPQRDFGAWLRTITRNLVRNELRRGGREARLLGRYQQWLDQHFEESERAREQDDELRQELQRCREGLAPPAAQALAMRYERAMGFDQIAAALGRTVAATRQLLSRVRIALRECVEQRRAKA